MAGSFGFEGNHYDVSMQVGDLVQVEVLSFAGDITIDKGQPKVHAHVVLGKADATAHGGHLIEGHVRPTRELVLTEMPRHLHRRFDAASGLALIDPAAAADGTLQSHARLGHPFADFARMRSSRMD